MHEQDKRSSTLFPVTKMRSVVRKTRKRIRRLPSRARSILAERSVAFTVPPKPELDFQQMQEMFSSDLKRYKKYVAASRAHLSEAGVSHLRYFSEEARGFMNTGNYWFWRQLLAQFRPSRMLEIGVYRGQTISLWQLLALELRFQAEITGVSPLSNAGDEIGQYLDIDYRADIHRNFRRFGLPLPELIGMRSNDPEVKTAMEKRRLEMIYIDGSHDYEIVKSDLELSLNSLVPSGLIVFDDSMKNSWNSRPSSLLNVGHPGPSRIADEAASDSRLVELGSCGHNRVFQSVK